MSKPRLLDLYCGGGGSAMGYSRAGFDVVGIDIYPQRLYPFPIVMNDAVDYLQNHYKEFDAVHASPPCQAHSITHYNSGNQGLHVIDMIPETREAIIATGLPYIIENTPLAPLVEPVTLCGWMEEIQDIYPLKVYRHRIFESNKKLIQPKHRKHPENVQPTNQHLDPNRWVTIVGKFSGIDVARKAMGIPWLTSRPMSQAIPPAYTTFLGRQLIAQL